MREQTRIVGIGGGTGLSVLLHGLRRCAAAPGPGRGIAITGVVSVADDGGSTGMLRQCLAIPAVGDLRNCIVALSQDNPLWAELFQHRFLAGDGIAGHALGNLIVAALVQRSGGLSSAVEQLTKPLRLGGKLLPVTEEPVSLCAQFSDGEVVRGESLIRARRQAIAELWLEPRRPRPTNGVLEAIGTADAIVLGPGSLYSSVLPNLLVDGVAESIRESSALRIFVCNLMTEPGETDGCDAVAHVAAIERHLGRGSVDICVMNNAPVAPETAARYAERGSSVIRADAAAFRGSATLPVSVDLLPESGTPDRHDAAKLARLVVALARTLRRETLPLTAARTPRARRRASRPAAAGLRVA